MTKPPNKVQGNESELYPNARERFEHAVDVVIKSGPKHRQAPPLNQRNVQHLKGAFTKARREPKLAQPSFDCVPPNRPLRPYLLPASPWR